MDLITNPFRPGAGRRPPVLAGREPILEAFSVVRRKVDELGEGDRGWILQGLNGVGKTVLLNEMLTQVSDKGWIAAKIEVSPAIPLSVALSAALVRSMRTATGRHPEPRLRRLLGVFKAFSLRFDPPSGMVSLGVEVDPVAGVADTGRFADDLSMLFEVLGETSRDLGIGTLILLDELQEASPADLSAINAAVHQMGQSDIPLPVVFVGAGLPSLPAKLADSTSYAQRLYDYRPIGLLDPNSAATALTLPTRAFGVTWESDALKAALAFAGGHPYFLQTVGKHVWDAARSATINVDDVSVGVEFARREVEESMYRNEWESATPTEQLLLRAMGALGGDNPVAISDLAAAMGNLRVSELSVDRNGVIKKGLLYAPERGQLAFTVPGMHTFIARQD